MTSLLSSAPVVPSPAKAFTLPGLLPAGACILLHHHPRQAILLLPGGETGMQLSVSPLSPSAVRVFQVLLQAYPGHSTYPQLFQALYALPIESPHWSQAVEVRPIRRAMFALAPTLRVFGLKALALRGRVYQLFSTEESLWLFSGEVRENVPQNRGESRLCARPLEKEHMVQ